MWIGIFNLMIVAQFWSFANDVYSKEEGERLFVIVGFGASLGAVVGARCRGSAHRAVRRPAADAGRRRRARPRSCCSPITSTASSAAAGRPNARAKKVSGAPAQNAFAMVFKTRYLLLMALMILLLNWINTTGEYILGSIVKEQAAAMVASGTARGLSEAQIIGGFYAKYFSLANVLGLLLQLFVVSRVIKYRGVAVAVMILPVLSFGVYNILIFVPLLNAVLAAKVVENSTDYSLNNTMRNMLFLPCTYEQKFTAKQAIDSFFVRMGDVLSAALVFVGTTFLALPSRRVRGGECRARHRRADPGVACRALLQEADGADRFRRPHRNYSEVRWGELLADG